MIDDTDFGHKVEWAPTPKGIDGVVHGVVCENYVYLRNVCF